MRRYIRVATLEPHLSRRRLVGAMGAGLLVACASGGPGGRALAGAPSPDWDGVYSAALAGKTMGYVYTVAQNGVPSTAGGNGLARSSQEADNPAQPWTVDTLFNLASVSKTITATAIMTIVQQQGAQILDSPFWPILVSSSRFGGTPGSGVDLVTMRQLLTMRSGLEKDGTLYVRNRTVDQFLADYLRQDTVSTPGSQYVYSNTNFTILQVLYEVLSAAGPGSYVGLVKSNVLSPMGIDTTTELTDAPAPQTEGLSYSGPSDTRRGQVWAQMQCVGPGGWLGTASGVLKFLAGLRGDSVLQPATAEMMFTQQLGWYRGNSPFGSYYHHNGGLHTGAQPPQELHTAAIHFPAGYDAVLFINSPSQPIIALMARAFGAAAPEQEAPE